MWWVKDNRGDEYPFAGYKVALVFFHQRNGVAIYWEPNNA